MVVGVENILELQFSDGDLLFFNYFGRYEIIKEYKNKI